MHVGHESLLPNYAHVHAYLRVTAQFYCNIPVPKQHNQCGLPLFRRGISQSGGVLEIRGTYVPFPQEKPLLQQ